MKRIHAWEENGGDLFPFLARGEGLLNRGFGVRTRLSLLVAALVALIALLIPFGNIAEDHPGVVVWITAGILLVLSYNAFLAAKRLRENPWLEPTSLLSVMFFFKYGFLAVVIYHWAQFPWEIFPFIEHNYSNYKIDANIPRACQLFLLAGLGLYLGSSTSGRRLGAKLPALNWKVDDKKLYRSLVLYTPVAIFILLVVQSYSPPMIQYIIALCGSALWVMIIIATYKFFMAAPGERGKWLGITLLMCAFRLPMFFWSMMRGDIATTMGMVTIGYILARYKLPLKYLFPVVPVVFFLLAPWLFLYKFTSGRESAAQDSATAFERFQTTNEIFLATPFKGLVELGLEGTLGRIAGGATIHSPVYIQYYPEIFPYENGETFRLELSGLVPRIFWPDKPNLSYDLNLYTQKVGLLGDPEKSAATFDYISEYFINFGPIGVFLLSILHGAYLRVLYEWLVRRSIYIIGASIYAVLFLQDQTSGLLQIFISDTRVLFIWIIIFYLMSRRRIAESHI